MGVNINIVTFVECSLKLHVVEAFSIFSFEIYLHGCFKTRV
jgi:hypothetical protein